VKTAGEGALLEEFELLAPIACAAGSGRLAIWVSGAQNC